MANDLNPDFQDLINCFTSHGVEFILVGAHALAFHGVARYTEDMDLWVRRTSTNAARVQAALRDFGVSIADKDVAALLEERRMIRIGNKPRRIEVLNFLDGCEFDCSWQKAPEEDLGGVPVKILSLEDYVATKIASGRAKDVSDLTLLREAIGPLPGDKA